MGYTTEFKGRIEIEPPLSPAEIAYLTKFSDTRRMERKNGPYYCGTGYGGQDNEPDIINYNGPPEGQPGLWCQWVPTEDGTALEWNGAEKFYNSAEWMAYLIDHFLKPGAIGKNADGSVVFGDHICNGTILAQGEDIEDRWLLSVDGNMVNTDDLVEVKANPK